jgi:hypothetical protein
MSRSLARWWGLATWGGVVTQAAWPPHCVESCNFSSPTRPPISHQSPLQSAYDYGRWLLTRSDRLRYALPSWLIKSMSVCVCQPATATNSLQSSNRPPPKRTAMHIVRWWIWLRCARTNAPDDLATNSEPFGASQLRSTTFSTSRDSRTFWPPLAVRRLLSCSRPSVI